LILLGHKTIEVRSQRTNIRESVYVYAGRDPIEAEEEARIASQFGIDVDALPRGILVGTVEIVDCRPLEMSDSRAACFEIDRPASALVHRDYEGREQRHGPRGALWGGGGDGHDGRGQSASGGGGYSFTTRLVPFGYPFTLH
jgi:hypothetical protein